MDVPNAYGSRNAARSARHEQSVVAFPSERRLSPRSDRSLGVSRADRRAWLAAWKPMHRHSRSARQCACSAGRLTGRPRYSARRVKVGFGGECGGSRAARADGAVVWAWKRRAEQLARMERDLMAHTTALGTADAAKWVGGCCEVGEPAGALFNAIARDNQHEYFDRSLRETSRGSSRGVWGPQWKFLAGEGGTRRASFYGGSCHTGSVQSRF